MRSATSSSKAYSWWNATLFKKNITRFWPIWGLYGAVWLLLLPFPVLSEGPYIGNFPPVLLRVFNPFGIFLAAGFGVLAAMAVFSYLYNPRAVNLMHSLPVRREALFLTNYVSGLSFFIGPQLVVALLTLAAQALTRCVDLGQLLLWFLVQTLFVLFFYSFAVFCAMFTGNLVALPVFYGILNLLPLGVATLLNALFGQFIFGFGGWSGLERAATWLTPAVKLFTVVDWDYTQTGDLESRVYTLSGVPVALMYALAGLVFAALALLVYRRRHLETAGDIVSVSWVRPVFKYGVAFCAALALGSWLRDFLTDIVPSGMYTTLAFLLFCGLAGYFVAEMLLKKSFKVFKQSWKGGAAFCAVLICAAVVMDLDLIGFNRIPALEEVRSVTLYGLYTRPSDSSSNAGLLNLEDPEEIETVTALHEYIVSHRRDIERELESGHERWEAVALAEGGTLDTRLYDSTTLSFNYLLENGSLVRRSYVLPLYQSDLDDPASAAAMLTALMNRDPAAAYLRNVPEDASVIQANLDVYNTETSAWENVSIEGDEARAALYAAVKSDLDAGRLGVRFLFDDMERYETCYTSNLSLTMFRYYPELESDPNRDPRPQWNADISLQTTASDTLEVLKELGVLDETHILLNHVDNQARLARLEEAGGDSIEEYQSGEAEAVPADDKDSYLVQGPSN